MKQVLCRQCPDSIFKFKIGWQGVPVSVDVAKDRPQSVDERVSDLQEFFSSLNAIFPLEIDGVFPECHFEVHDAPDTLQNSFSDDLLDWEQAKRSWNFLFLPKSIDDFSVLLIEFRNIINTGLTMLLSISLNRIFVKLDKRISCWFKVSIEHRFWRVCSR